MTSSIRCCFFSEQNTEFRQPAIQTTVAQRVQLQVADACGASSEHQIAPTNPPLQCPKAIYSATAFREIEIWTLLNITDFRRISHKYWLFLIEVRDHMVFVIEILWPFRQMEPFQSFCLMSNMHVGLKTTTEKKPDYRASSSSWRNRSRM